MINVIMHTIGVISILWMMIQLIALWEMMNSFQVVHLKRKIIIHGRFFLPVIGIVFYTIWLFIG